MMFSKADIRRISIVVTGNDYNSFIVSLGNSGLVHIGSEISSEPGALVNDMHAAGLSVNKTSAERIISAVKEFLPEPSVLPDNLFNFDLFRDDIYSIFSRDNELDLHDAEKIKNKTKQYNKIRAMIVKELELFEMKLREIRELSKNGIDLERLRGLKYVSYIYGRFSGDIRQYGIDKMTFYIIIGYYILILCTPDLKDGILNNLRSEKFEDLDYIIGYGKTFEEEEDAAEKKITELQKRLIRIDSFYQKNLHQWESKMFYLAAVYSFLLKIYGVETKFHFSSELVIINGWINVRDSENLYLLLNDVCGKRFYLKIASRMESRKFKNSVPVQMKNNPLFRPFELLVRMMGMPANDEVDPTPAAALAYILIFGVMFGDAGQGLVLTIAGLIIKIYWKNKYKTRNNFSDFGSIMIWCGFSAMIFGFLYGSVFSNEHIIPALLFHPMSNMMELLLMAIMTGTVFISIGLVLNIVNGLFSGRYEESLFGTKGAAGLVIYISLIFFSMRFIFSNKIPAASEIVAALSIPAVFFCIRGPLEYILFHGEQFFPHGLFEYVIETLIEIIEMFSNFIGNTISYIRAGAFALSHAGLSIAVFTLAGMIDPSMKSAGSLSVIVTGNIFIILLEGLVCGIQSMRLEYYEFFSKFYSGDGVPFTPFFLDFKLVKDGGFK